MPDSTAVLVIGGGPAGSATALRLASLGHTVRLLDRAIFPRDKACSEYLSPAAVRELGALDILPQLVPGVGAPISATRVTTARGSHLTGRFGPSGAPTGLAIPRRRLDHTLLETAKAAGVLVEHAHMTDVLRDANGVIGVMARAGDSAPLAYHARVVVGADGLRSLVARRTGSRRQGRLRRVAFSAHLRGVAGLSSCTEMQVGSHGYLGMNWLGADLCNVTLVVDAASARSARSDATGFFWQRLRAIPALQDRLQHATVARQVMVTGPFDARCRRSTGNGFLLVGDAADFFDPFTGDGIHSALVGARLAATVLHDALQQPGAISTRRLAAYPRLRRRAFLGKWLLERIIGNAMEAPRLFDRAIARLDRRGMADVLIGATGHEISPWRVVNPVFIARMVL